MHKFPTVGAYLPVRKGNGLLYANNPPALGGYPIIPGITLLLKILA